MAVATSPVGMVSTGPPFPSLMACLASPISALLDGCPRKANTYTMHLLAGDMLRVMNHVYAVIKTVGVIFSYILTALLCHENSILYLPPCAKQGVELWLYSCNLMNSGNIHVYKVKRLAVFMY